jgi:hypothetical protein
VNPSQRRPPARWVALAAVVAAVAGLTVWLVRAPRPASAGPLGSAGLTGENAPHVHVTGDASAGPVAVGGVTASVAGYTLRPLASAFPPGVRAVFRFVVDGPDGQPVTRYAIQRDKPLHLVIARRDLTGYQHLHPTLAADGTWSVPLILDRPGGYRAYADFAAVAPGGATTAVVLAVDLSVAGTAPDTPLPAPASSADVAGFTVGYQGTPVPGTVQPLLFTVSRAGAPVLPGHYLGAYGHLVVLRAGDLAYLHVHPEDRLAAGAVKFWLAAPGPGSYRAYFDFQVDGQPHTAEFTLVVP